MSSVINADTSDGLKFTSDTSGEIKLQSAGTDIATVTSSGATVEFADGSASTPSITNSGDTNTGIFFPASDTIAFAEGGAEAMRIDSSGNLSGAGNTSSTNFGLNWGGGKTTTAFNCAQIAGAYLGSSGSGGGVDYTYIGYNFYTTTTNGTYKYAGGDYAAAIRYGSGGKIETYTATSGTANNTISWVAGPYVANSGTSWTNSSDERLKNITGEITDAINKVSQLRAAEFTWKSDKSNKPQVGLIAQDVQKVLPEVVVVPEKEFDGTAETAIGVNYDEVIPLLVAAIKEQQDIIKALETRIQALENA